MKTHYSPHDEQLFGGFLKSRGSCYKYGATHVWWWHLFWLVVWNIWIIFPYIGNVIIPTDELKFFRGVGIPPTSIDIYNFELDLNINWWLLGTTWSMANLKSQQNGQAPSRFLGSAVLAPFFYAFHTWTMDNPKRWKGQILKVDEW